MKIKKLNRNACKQIREQLNAELVAVGERLGLTIHAGNASFSASSVTFKVECTLEGVDKAKEDFEADCYLYHLPASAYKAEFKFNRSTWILEGLKTRSPKFPIIASKKGEEGNYKLPRRAIESLQDIPKAEVVDFVPRTA